MTTGDQQYFIEDRCDPIGLAECLVLSISLEQYIRKATGKCANNRGISMLSIPGDQGESAHKRV